MKFITEIPGTDIKVSALGLGTVKFGRDQGVKYPHKFTIPDDKSVRKLLALAQELGINLIDTAPAYGNSEQRLGNLISNRADWIIASKVGENFQNGESTFDFSARHTLQSVERSLRRLKTDYLDIVLIHSDGSDKKILEESDCLAALRQCQEKGLIRTIGMSCKTRDGGLLALKEMDILMLTYNLEHQEKEIVKIAKELKKGVLVKKGLMGGHIINNDEVNPVRQSLHCIFQQSGINSVIVGTINPEHLKQNVEIAKQVLEEF